MYYAVLTTSPIHRLPAGVENPGGVYESLADAASAIHECEEQWAAHGLSFPHSNVRVNEYATREQAERADVADGFVIGQTGDGYIVEGTKPLRIYSLPLPKEN
jgi:hypothetical protein